LCQATVWPGGTVAGFGENDCAPFSRTTLIVMAPAGGAAVPVGLPGVGLVGVGFVGDGLVGDELVELPQPYTAKVVATKAIIIRKRCMGSSFLHSSGNHLANALWRCRWLGMPSRLNRPSAARIYSGDAIRKATGA
jgi:hypothetical protein